MPESIRKVEAAQTEFFLVKARWILLVGLVLLCYFYLTTTSSPFARGLMIATLALLFYNIFIYLYLKQFPSAMSFVQRLSRILDFLLIFSIVTLLHIMERNLTYNAAYGIYLAREYLRGSWRDFYTVLFLSVAAMFASGIIVQAAIPGVTFYDISLNTVGNGFILTAMAFIIQKIMTTQEQLWMYSLHDSLTGLYNHRLFHEMLNHHIAQIQRGELTSITLLSIDLDDFKKVNDKYGHMHGDTVLHDFAQVLKKTIRQGDTAYRVGGEEFAVILTSGGTDGAKYLAERFRKNLLAESKRWHPPLSLTVSMGVATFGEDAQTKDELIHQADQAMYQAKRTGKDRISGIDA